MARTFIESPDAVNGATGDAVTWLWSVLTGTVTYDTTVKNNGAGSWEADSTAGNTVSDLRRDGVITGTSRVTGYFYYDSTPSATAAIIRAVDASANIGWQLRITTGNVLNIHGGSGGTLNKSGATTLSTATWYRISVGWTLSSTSSFTINVYLNGTLEIAATGADGTIEGASPTRIRFGWVTAPGASKNIYFQNIITDDGSGNDDIGNYYTTAKLPAADGTLVEFTTAIGGAAGAHFDDVAERPGAEANGWSIATTLIKTEEYSIQGVAVGDVDLTGLTLLDFMGWVRAKISATSGTPVTNIILAGSASAITLTTSYATYLKMAGSTTYPVGLVDIGMNGLAASSRTFSLAECGIVFAYNPTASGATVIPVPINRVMKNRTQTSSVQAY